MNNRQMNTHIWKLAEVVHPRKSSMNLVEWTQKILNHYEIEGAKTIDGQLPDEQAYRLWTCLIATEIERSDKVLDLVRSSLSAPVS